MSRIGKMPIEVPADVTVTLGENNHVTVKGPKGELTNNLSSEIKIEQEDKCDHIDPSFRIERTSLHPWNDSFIFSSCEHGNRRFTRIRTFT